MKEIFNFTAADISAGVIGGLITALLLALPLLFRRALRFAASLNDHWSARINQAELDKLLRLSTHREELQQFLQQQVLWVMALIGAAMMFIPLALTPSGLKFAAFAWTGIGCAIYMIALFALGMLRRIQRDPEKAIASLRKRIADVEARIAQRQRSNA